MARKPVVDMSAWPSLSLEGNLIAPAMVASVDRREASEQTEADYRIRKGLTIREEISTAFRVGQSHFDTFARIARPHPGWSIARVQHLLYVDTLDRIALAAFLDLPGLTPSWRRLATRRLETASVEDWSGRLDG